MKKISYYNNKVHRLIDITPNKAYKITNIEDINRINEIKNKEFKKFNN